MKNNNSVNTANWKSGLILIGSDYSRECIRLADGSCLQLKDLKKGMIEVNSNKKNKNKI